MDSTNQHSLKTFAKVLLSKFENKKMILFEPQQRSDLLTEFFNFLSGKILTDEKLSEMARAQVAQKSESLATENISESEAFQSQKRALRSKYGEHVVQGFYLRESLRSTALAIVQFLLQCPLVEEVFESDDVLSQMVISTMQTFDESKIS